MFSRILIANRGEIALRIIRACKELGIQTVAVYSEGDRPRRQLLAPGRRPDLHRPAALGRELPEHPADHRRGRAGRRAGHPPRLRLTAENAHFAEVCRSCKIEFIGPSVAAMRSLGDKIKRKLWPSGPTSPPPRQQRRRRDRRAGRRHRRPHRATPWPSRRRPAAAGAASASCTTRPRSAPASSRPSRRPRSPSRTAGCTWRSASRTSGTSRCRSWATFHGNLVHLFERECSLQRRRQKVIEETPSSTLDPAVRQEICASAVRLAREVGYANAGTVEFMLERGEQLLLPEVNTRIQVEHPITEMVTGEDLVKWQLRVAAGERLSVKQEDVRQAGHAIECRINAEDPSKNFRPSPGRIEAFIPPGGLGVRWDSHIYQGYIVPPRTTACWAS